MSWDYWFENYLNMRLRIVDRGLIIEVFRPLGASFLCLNELRAIVYMQGSTEWNGIAHDKHSHIRALIYGMELLMGTTATTSKLIIDVTAPTTSTQTNWSLMWLQQQHQHQPTHSHSNERVPGRQRNDWVLNINNVRFISIHRPKKARLISTVGRAKQAFDICSWWSLKYKTVRTFCWFLMWRLLILWLHIETYRIVLD